MVKFFFNFCILLLLSSCVATYGSERINGVRIYRSTYATDDTSFAKAQEWCNRLGKKPVLVKEYRSGWKGYYDDFDCIGGNDDINNGPPSPQPASKSKNKIPARIKEECAIKAGEAKNDLAASKIYEGCMEKHGLSE